VGIEEGLHNSYRRRRKGRGEKRGTSLVPSIPRVERQSRSVIAFIIPLFLGVPTSVAADICEEHLKTNKCCDKGGKYGRGQRTHLVERADFRKENTIRHTKEIQYAREASKR
jgi:hypothetical protein